MIELLYLQRARLLTLDSQMLAVLSSDNLLASLGLSPQERLQWYGQFFPNTKEGGMIYRLQSSELRALLKDTQYIQSLQGGQKLLKVLDARRVRLLQVAQQLSALEMRRDLTQPLQHIYGSFLHMHYNRLRGTNRQAERSISELARRTWLGLVLHRD